MSPFVKTMVISILLFMVAFFLYHLWASLHQQVQTLFPWYVLTTVENCHCSCHLELIFFALVPEVFLELQESRETAKDESWSGKKRKSSGYLGLESHFHADASCQICQTDNYKRDQWQLSNHALALPIKRTNHIDLRVCKNINQFEPDRGVCMKVRFKSKVTGGFSLLAALRLCRGSRKILGTRVEL